MTDNILVERLRELDDALAHEAADYIELLEKGLIREGHDALCYYCGQACNDLAANPGQWAIPLSHPDDPGRVKWHHMECVSNRLEKLKALEEGGL